MTGILSQNEVIKRKDSQNSWISTTLSTGNKEIMITSYGPKLMDNEIQVETIIVETIFFKKKGTAIVTDERRKNEEIIINKGESIDLFKTLHTMFSNNTWCTFGLEPELKRKLFETVHEQFVQLAMYYLELHQDDIECMFGVLEFFPKVDDIVFRSRDIIIESRGEAEEVLDKMIETSDYDNIVTVADYYNIIGVESSLKDNIYGWGWKDLKKAYIEKVDGGFYIKLPKPKRF